MSNQYKANLDPTNFFKDPFLCEILIHEQQIKKQEKNYPSGHIESSYRQKNQAKMKDIQQRQQLRNSQNDVSHKICRICEEQQNSFALIEFGPCGHYLCEGCFKKYGNFKLNNFELIFCPFGGCNNKLQKRMLQNQNIFSQKDKLKYLKIQRQLLFLMNPELKSCKQNSCQGILNSKLIQQQLQKDQLYIPKCQECKMQLCPKCYEQRHEGECEKEIQKQIAKYLQRNNKFRQCSRCMRVIEKSQGCTKMTCMCGFYFCYMCGQKLGTQNHQCKVPNQFNFLQSIRWEVEHIELFYQSSLFSFHRLLYFFDLSPQKPILIRLLWSLVYTVTIYPLTICFGIVLTSLLIVLCVFFATLMIMVLPSSEIFCNRQYCVTSAVQSIVGNVGLILLMIVFYPVFIVAILVETIINIWKNQQIGEEIQIVLKEIGLGLRNILLMPLILCVNPQSIDVE